MKRPQAHFLNNYLPTGTVPPLEQLNESTEEADQNVAATGVKSE